MAELAPQAQLKVHLCGCGLLFPDTQHGREKQLRTCEGASSEVATHVRREREQGGNESAFSGALAGLTTQSMGVIVSGSDVVIGALRFTARDCCWVAGSHSNVCFYRSCTDGNTTDVTTRRARAEAAPGRAGHDLRPG